ELGGVYAYKIQSQDEGVSLKYISSQLSEGAPPCHLSSADNTLLAANYHKGSIGMFPIQMMEQSMKEHLIIEMDMGYMNVRRSHMSIMLDFPLVKNMCLRVIWGEMMC